MRNRPRAITGVTALGVAAVLLLGGCSFLPQIPTFNGGDGSSSDNSGGGDDVENNPFLDHDIPEGFPSEVPLPDLEIYLSLRSSEDSWSIIYKGTDVESDFRGIVEGFEGAGWETIMNNPGADGSLGVFKLEPYTAQVMAVPEGGDDFDGPGITFTVVRT